METDANYLNRTLAPTVTNILNQICREEGVGDLFGQSEKPIRNRRVYREVFHPYKGEGRNTYMIRYVRMKDEAGEMWAALYRKRGKEWNELDCCEAKSRKVIDRKIQTWKKRYDA
jgi:hypothetical protein